MSTCFDDLSNVIFMIYFFTTTGWNECTLPVTYNLTLPLRKNLLGSKRKAINIYFAIL